MKKLLLTMMLILVPVLIFAQPNTEFRSTWVISWDLVNRYLNVDGNKELCRDIMDNHSRANMNAVIWQARQSGTAYYKSSYEPWGYYTGGTNPGYDILEYAVEQAHKRNMELHAWFNVFHCSSVVFGAPASKHPEWVCTNKYGEFMTNHRCLSPGIPEVREYLINVAMEIVRKYDIDGLHLDFVRWNEYTEDDMTSALTKEAEIAALDGQITQEQIERLNETGTLRYIYDAMHPYNNGVPEGFSSWDDWRRWTVTEFVKTLQDSIKSVKPWVKLSTAALGKYNWDGWQAYGTVFQDAALWFNEGYVDQLMPMHYHWTNASEFYSMLVGPNGDSDYIRCWGKYIQKGIEDGRLYTVGPGSYQLHAKNVWDNHESIVKKMREIEWVDGLQFFSYSNWVTHNYWGVANELFFPTPTKIKATVGEDTLAPETPVISITKLDSMVYRISIEESSFGEEPSRFIIYRSKDSTLTPESSNIAYIKYTNSGFHYNDYIKEQKGGYYYYGVTTADRYWNESELSNIVRTEELPHESVVPVPPILEYVRKLDSGYEVKWAHSGVNDCRGYRLYARAMDTNWYLLLDENTLDVGTTHAIVNTEIEEVPWFFSIRAVGLGPAGYESEDSDIYGAYISDTDRVLVIDAFDRTTGEWSLGTHPFAMKVCESLSRANISYDCGTDEAFEHKDILSDEYKAIFWLCGDAAGQDEVVGFNSMSYLANYLSKGGQLLISGSEIAYDMDYRGSYQDKKFIHEVLKVNYVSNGENGNGYKVDGTDQGIFSGLSFNFDDGTGGFRILKPDVIDTTNGSVPCFKYSNRNEIAGVQYQGTISNGQEDARIITLGFPFESIYVEEQLDQFVSRVLEYFNITEEIGISAPVERVEDFSLCRNYPNPFNSSTIIQFSLPEAATVKLEIFNVKGQRVYEQSYAFSLSGVKNITWDANDLSSGVYHYRISQLNGNQQLLHHGKMLYMK